MMKPVDLNTNVDDGFSLLRIWFAEKQWVDALGMALILCGAGFAINQQLHLTLAEVLQLAWVMALFRLKAH